jgi:hypothetical protein
VKVRRYRWRYPFRIFIETVQNKIMFPGRSFLMLLALLPALSFAGERSVFQGTLEGVGTVVMELEASTQQGVEEAAGLSGTVLETSSEANGDKGKYIGRYFYARHGVDIPLFGALERLTEPKLPSERDEEEMEKDEASPKAYWEGKIVQGHFRGQWVDATSKRARRFDLTRVARYDPEKTRPGGWQMSREAIAGGVGSGLAYDVKINPQQTPYEYLKLQGYSVPVEAIVPGQTETVAWQPHRDPRSKFHYPRLVRHPNPDIMKRINTILEQRHWQMTLAALSCVSSVYEGNGRGGDLGDYDDEKIKVDFLSETLMSVSEAGSTYCGGAHPNDHYDPFTLDLIRGEYLDWNRLFKAFTRDESGKWWNPSSEMKDLIERTAKNKTGEKFPEPVTGEVYEGRDCDFVEYMRDYLALHFDKPGHLALTVSGVGHCCGFCLGVHAEIPFSALGKILKPEAKRYFPELKGKN